MKYPPRSSRRVLYAAADNRPASVSVKGNFPRHSTLCPVFSFRLTCNMASIVTSRKDN